MINMTLNLAPVAKERARITRFGNYTPAKTLKFERDAAMIMRSLMQGKPLDGPLKLTARFVLKRPKRPKHKTEPITRPDTDNYLKALKDAATGVLWVDDSHVVHEDARKLYGEPSRIELQLEVV